MKALGMSTKVLCTFLVANFFFKPLDFEHRSCKNVQDHRGEMFEDASFFFVVTVTSQ